MASQNLEQFADFSTNTSNPFYIHPNETSAVVLVQPPLEGSKNFQPWIRSMRVSLISKNKMIFVDGTVTVPEKTSTIYNQWFCCNNLVLAWLQRSVSSNVAKSIVFFDKAYDAWKDLHDRFDQGDMFRIGDIQEDIYKVSQGTRDVSEYYTELKSLWDELDSFRPFSSCSCAIPCTCGALVNVKKFKEQDYTIRFLKGLNEEYAHVKSQIMRMDPFPNITKAFSLVIQQERNMNPTGCGSTETESEAKIPAQVNHVQSNNRGGYGYRGRGRSGRGQGRGQV